MEIFQSPAPTRTKLQVAPPPPHEELIKRLGCLSFVPSNESLPPPQTAHKTFQI